MSHQSAVVLSALHSQAAHAFLIESLAGPQQIAPLPRVCAQLAELTAQNSTDAAQLSRLIQSDPALAGELMRVANSPALRPRSPIVSLQQAVSWLGVAEVRNIAMAVMLRGEVFSAPGHEPESEELWREAWLGRTMGQRDRPRAAQAGRKRISGCVDAPHWRRPHAEDSRLGSNRGSAPSWTREALPIW